MSTVACGDVVGRGVAGELDLATTAAGVDDERAVGAEAVARRDPRQRAHAVAAHLGDAAVGVVEEHRRRRRRRCPGLTRSGRRRRCRCGGRRARAPVAELIVQLDGVRPEPRPHEEVVAGGVQLRQPDGSHALQLARRAGSTVHGFSGAPNQLIRGSRRNHMRWRRANWRVRTTVASSAASSDGSSRRDGRAPPGSRWPARRCGRARRGRAAPRTSSTRPASRMAATRAAMRRVEHVARAATRRRCARGRRLRRTSGCRCRTTRTVAR